MKKDFMDQGVKIIVKQKNGYVPSPSPVSQIDETKGLVPSPAPVAPRPTKPKAQR
jgi:hypothetical protein